MKRVIIRAALLAAVGALIAGAPATAHHSVSAEFDTTKPISFSGTIKKVEWTNPHIYTQVESKGPDGKITIYRVEGGAPNSLFRQGWRKDSLKVGEAVSVTGIRAKRADSMNVGQATITTSDGRRMFAGGGGQQRAAEQQQPN
jgi:hypothetical protein